MSMIYPGNENANCSDVWTGKVANCPAPVVENTSGHPPMTANHFILLIIVALISSFIVVV
jgi:hypothetical protein